LIATRFIFRSLKNTDACTEGFTKVIDAIEKVIYQQKFEGAAVGGFNANLNRLGNWVRDAVMLVCPISKRHSNVIPRFKVRKSNALLNGHLVNPNFLHLYDSWCKASNQIFNTSWRCVRRFFSFK